MPIDYNRRVQDEDTTVGTPSGVITTATSQANPSMQGSGQFSNLQDYIKANEGANNATASRVGSDIENRYGSALENINTGVSQIGQKKGEIDAQRNQFNDVVSGAGTSSITAAQIANARNMAMGVSGVNEAPRLQANQMGAQFEQERQSKANELKNIGSGVGIQDYLRGVRSNPSSSTTGELRLDEFLTRQTPEGANQLQNAVSRGSQVAANQQIGNAIGGVEASYANLSPTSLSDYVRQQRGSYQTGLGNVNRSRASTLAMERRGISDINAAKTAYENSLATARANDQALRAFAASAAEANRNISAYNNDIAQADQLAGTGNTARLAQLMSQYGIGANESANVDTRYGNRATAMRNDLMRGLQSLRSAKAAEIESANKSTATRQAELAASIQATDPYSLYNTDVANVRTRQDALRANEMARLQALYSLSGEDEAYRNYLTGGI
ncbi:hypothetical protein UFOVP683_18 [uncultured Caudovirales phage]|uniref:Uncharacterized protein n=1 Tax=uncultured Caudovirales phage TaxID=2100421 RepID=A0A6J5NJG2_9CAUD|nr:hypothetical protein UFOVP683_18 [uncultured Caudovirales phage]